MLDNGISKEFYALIKIIEKKLDQKAKYGVFVGYSNLTKGYEIYQPLKRKIIVSRDVKFDEVAR